MSNALQYDPLLVRYLAAELDERLRDRGCAAAPFFAGDRSASLALAGGGELRLDLHPARGWVRVLGEDGGGWDENQGDAPIGGADRRSGSGTGPRPDRDDDPELDAVCTGVSAPEDERILHLHLEETGRFRSQSTTVVVELATNQWNVLAVGRDGRIVSALRARRGGRRPLLPGLPYEPPPSQRRFGVDEVPRESAWEEWARCFDSAAPEEWRGRLLAGFAATGAINADWILGSEIDRASRLREAFERWWWLRSYPPARPRLLRLGGRDQPYPLPLRGIESESLPSLLAGMARLGDAVPRADEPVDAGPAGGGGTPDLDRATTFAAGRLAAGERKLEQLRAELGRAGDAGRIRGWGDVLLARLHEVPRGAASVSLEGWEGETVEIPLDPALTPAENAARHYDEAARIQRAEERIPKLIQATETELERWRAAAAAIADGAVPDWLGKAIASRDGGQRAAGAAAGATPAPPYRTYRTSGGLEVRVGRGSRDNDRLTFRESSPNDVWLHARSVPGSHVILRWSDPDASPPARDLAEAAQLAALFSRARSSALVPVDWTRRKYVRKPRGAAPGAVVPQRVKTLFVEPDEAVAERLAERG